MRWASSLRELERGPAAAEAEHKRLVELVGSDGTLEELNRVLCTMIREGKVGLDTPGLAAASRTDDARQGRRSTSRPIRG